MADPWSQFADPPAPDGWAAFADAPGAGAPQAPGPRRPEVVQAEFDALPWYKKAGQAADDLVRLAANGVTFGYADKLAGALNGTGADAERALSQEAQDRAGLAGDVAEIGGSLALPLGAARSGLTLAGRLGAKALPGVAGLAARSGLMGLEGAGYGTLDAAGHDQPLSEGALTGAIFGTGGNAAAEEIGHAAGKVAGLFGRSRVPTMNDLEAARDAAYQAADNAGVIYTPHAITRIQNDVTQKLADMGYDPALQPGAAAVLNRLNGLAGQNITLKGLDTLRKVANNGYVPGNKANDRAVGIITNSIDDLVDNPAAQELLVGNAQGGADALQSARDYARRAFKATEINDALERADRRAMSTGKGANVDNTTRQNINRILDRGARGYSPDEIAAMNHVVNGTPGQNFLRWMGGFAPQNIVGGGMGGLIGAEAAHALGLPGAAGAATTMGLGYLSKKTADAMTRGNTDDLLDIIMSGRKPTPNGAQQAVSASTPDLARIIMQSGNTKVNQ